MPRLGHGEKRQDGWSQLVRVVGMVARHGQMNDHLLQFQRDPGAGIGCSAHRIWTRGRYLESRYVREVADHEVEK
jgi:hypothetical protein